MAAILNWIREKSPKIYLLNTQEYPKFEYPHGTGVMHDYPHYSVFGRRMPNAYVGLGGVLGLAAIVQACLFLGRAVSGKSSAESANAPLPLDTVPFPSPKRDFEAEKREFVERYVQNELLKQHASHQSHH